MEWWTITMSNDGTMGYRTKVLLEAADQTPTIQPLPDDDVVAPHVVDATQNRFQRSTHL